MVNESDYVNVFSKKFTGGPLNLGDPEDKSLRHVEEIFIKKLVQDRAHHEMCHNFVQGIYIQCCFVWFRYLNRFFIVMYIISEWGLCMEKNQEGWRGALSFLTCRKPLNEMNECLVKYYKDPSFYDECKNMYLNKRANYRRTGVIEKDKYDKKKYYESEYKKNLKKYIESTKNSQQQQQQDPNKWNSILFSFSYFILAIKKT